MKLTDWIIACSTVCTGVFVGWQSFLLSQSNKNPHEDVIHEMQAKACIDWREGILGLQRSQQQIKNLIALRDSKRSDVYNEYLILALTIASTKNGDKILTSMESFFSNSLFPDYSNLALRKVRGWKSEEIPSNSIVDEVIQEAIYQHSNKDFLDQYANRLKEILRFSDTQSEADLLEKISFLRISLATARMEVIFENPKKLYDIRRPNILLPPFDIIPDIPSDLNSEEYLDFLLQYDAFSVRDGVIIPNPIDSATYYPLDIATDKILEEFSETSASGTLERISHSKVIDGQIEEGIEMYLTIRRDVVSRILKLISVSTSQSSEDLLERLELWETPFRQSHFNDEVSASKYWEETLKNCERVLRGERGVVF